MKRATISDVAKRAKVSKSTVSHVINETRFVGDETKQRVLDAIEELGYRPNRVAQSLTTNRTHTIGIIVSDVTNHFFGELIRSIENTLETSDYSLIVCNTDEQLEREQHYLNLLMSQHVDGIIAAATSQYWHELEMTFLKYVPVVFLDRKFGELDDYPYVGANNYQGTYIATEHLVNHGHQHIGLIAGFQRLSSMRERLQGFKDALIDHDLNIRDEWIAFSKLDVGEGYQAAKQILTATPRPTALVINNNFLNLGTLKAVNELGLRVPKDIALVGFDDHPWAEVSCPPLTVVRQPVHELGQLAAKMILKLLNDESLEQPTHVLDCELIVRKSCGAHTTNE